MGFQDLRELRDHKDLKAIRVSLDLVVHKGLEVREDFQAPAVQEVPQDQQDHLVPLVSVDPMVSLDLLDLPDNRGPQE